MINYPIGEIFQETGIVSPEQLKAALHVQKASRLKLGEILVKLNFVTYTELARVVAMQKDLDYVDLHASVPEDEALTLIDQETALNNALIPMRLKDELLHVVTANPDDDMRDYLQTLTGKTVRFEVSDVPSIAKFVQFYYGQLQGSIETKIETLIESANNDEEIDIIELSELIIENAVKDRATDIHIIPELLSSHVFYRIDGVLQHYFSLPTALHHYLITRLKVLGNLDIVENLKSQSGEFEYHFLDSDYSVRISAVPTMKGEKIAMRLLPENFMLYSMEDLGFEEAMIEKITAYLHKNSGMVLIIGPSGSGKTTTLYSMLRKVNILERNVLSIEEPVEFQLPFVSQLEVNHGSGMTYSSGLRHIARQDPDIIVIGEILDEETAQLAARNSLTGHLILTTIFGNRPSSSITRMKDFGVDKHTLADGLIAIISQKLVRRLCNHCKEAAEIGKAELQHALPALASAQLSDETYTVYHPVGCPHCKQSGYHGRLALAEFFEVDDAVRQMISDDQNSIELDAYIKERELQTIADDALTKLLNGDTSLEEVQRI